MYRTNEAVIEDVLVQVREHIQRLMPHAEAYRVADYEIVSALLGAAEAVISGLIDERVLLALDILAETLHADLEDMEQSRMHEAVLPDTNDSDGPIVLSA
jgi:hypothetical protein